uniref:Uncharacterized protein n=1 Tax=Onchocerca volvulus TaxID=6282 RepID=A0A8R1TJM7_ONCVO
MNDKRELLCEMLDYCFCWKIKTRNRGKKYLAENSNLFLMGKGFDGKLDSCSIWEILQSYHIRNY